MEDAFSLFGLDRRPLIDEAALKERYLRLAATRHPDLAGGNDEKFHLVAGRVQDSSRAGSAIEASH